MDNQNLVQFGALLIALVSLIVQQQRIYLESRKKEKRIETKLRIFKIFEGKEIDLSEEEIIKELSAQNPLGKIDQAEIKKSLYEMLVEETIRYTTGKKYKPRLRSQRTAD